jgi:hypothetical protein
MVAEWLHDAICVDRAMRAKDPVIVVVLTRRAVLLTRRRRADVRFMRMLAAELGYSASADVIDQLG